MRQNIIGGKMCNTFVAPSQHSSYSPSAESSAEVTHGVQVVLELENTDVSNDE